MEMKPSNLFSDKLAWGLTLLTGALLTDAVLSGYSLANLSTQVNAETINNAATGVNPVQMVISCMSPLGFLLKIVAIFLIFQDSKRLSALTEGRHRRMVVAATICFVSGLLMLIISTFLSFSGVMSGSNQSLQISMVLSLVAGLLGYITTFLLVFQVLQPTARIALIVALVIAVLSSSSVSIMTIQNTVLESYEMMGNSFFVPSLNLDRTQGLYPLAEGAGTLAILLTLGILLTTAIQAWRSLTRELPESVA